MSKVVGFVLGAVEIGIGVAIGNVGLIIMGGLTIAAQALVDLTAPNEKARDASEMSIALGEQPRSAFFGEGYTPGSLVDAFDYGGKYGTDWEVLIIRLADHKCDSLTGFYVNDVYVAYTGDGAVPGYNSQLEVYFRADTTTDPLPSIITTNGPGWTSSDIGQSGCDVIVAYKADSPTAKKPIWPGGRPRFGWVLKGKLCYDPRLDDTVTGGSGAHRWDDPTTWEWSDNAAICRYNWVRGIFADDDTSDQSKLLVGRGLTAIEAPPENIFSAANICDEAGCTLYPYDTKTSSLSWNSNFIFAPGVNWMAYFSGGATEWWNVGTRSLVGSSASIGVMTGSQTTPSLGPDGTAYCVGLIQVGVDAVQTFFEIPPLSDPIATTIPSPVGLFFTCTRAITTSGGTSVYSAHAAATGYLIGTAAVSHSQSARDFCLTAADNVAILFHPSGSSADFTIEDGAGNTFTVTGLATRSGPTTARFCHVASEAHFFIETDGYWYAVDDTTGAIKASGVWPHGSPPLAEQTANNTSFWMIIAGTGVVEYSLVDATALQTIPTSNWSGAVINVNVYAYDAINDAIWTRGESSTNSYPPTIIYLDRGSGFKVAGPIYSDQEFLEVEGMFASACAGNLVTHDGDFQLEPAQAKSVVATITDDDIITATTVSWNWGFLSESDDQWINTVVANYIEPDQKWNAHDAPVVRDSSDVLADGKPREASLTLRLVRYQGQALRIAEISRRLGRLWGRAQVTLGPRFCELEAGDWISWQSDRYFGGASKTFQIQANQIDKTWRNELTIREISSSAFSCGTFQKDYSQATPTTPPPDIGTPDAGNWALAAVTMDSAGASIPALEITGSASDDVYAESIVFEYWKYDGSTDPTIDPDSIGWTLYSNAAPDTTKVDITSIVGGATYYAAVSYVVNGIPGDRLVLGPVTVADYTNPNYQMEDGTTFIMLEDDSTNLVLG